MSKWVPEVGDIVRFRRKYVERGQAPSTLWEVLGGPDPQRMVLLGPAPGRAQVFFGGRHLRSSRKRHHRPAHQGTLALVEPVSARLAHILMGDE